MDTGNLSNGPIEGINRKIKQIKRTAWLQELGTFYLPNPNRIQDQGPKKESNSKVN